MKTKSRFLGLAISISTIILSLCVSVLAFGGTWNLVDPANNVDLYLNLEPDTLGYIPFVPSGAPQALANIPGQIYEVEGYGLPFHSAIKIEDGKDSWLVLWRNNPQSGIAFKLEKKQSRDLVFADQDSDEILLKAQLTKEEYMASYDDLNGLTGPTFRRSLKDLISKHVVYSYTDARKEMFSNIFNENGMVECIYTDLVMRTNSIPDAKIMNTEHTWPQSQFKGDDDYEVFAANNSGLTPADCDRDTGAKKTDIFHLFPSSSEANSRRSNWPFGMVENIKWTKDGCKLGTDKYGRTVFEPEAEHKGDVARALFYFAVSYGMNIENTQEQVLRKWHEEDPVSDKERAKCDAIFQVQKNRNPFIDRPDFVSRIQDF